MNALVELHQELLALALKSHRNGSSLMPKRPSAEDDIGGRRPPGAIDEHGDREAGFRQKTAQHFVRRLLALGPNPAPRRIEALTMEVRQALWDWEHTPAVDGVPLARDTFEWKCLIADDPRPVREVVQFYSVSRASVSRYRARYRGVRSVPVERRRRALTSSPHGCSVCGTPAIGDVCGPCLELRDARAGERDPFDARLPRAAA